MSTTQSHWSAATIFEDQQFPLAVVAPQHDTEISFHDHDFLEIVYVKSGNGLHRVDYPAGTATAGPCERSYPIMAGDLFAITIGERHAYVETDALNIVNIMFTPSLISTDLLYLQDIPGVYEFFVVEPLFRAENGFRYKLHLKSSVRNGIENLISEIGSELDRKEPGYKAIAKGLFLQLLTRIGRAFSMLYCSPMEKSFLQGKRNAIQRAIAYMEENYSRSLSLQIISNEAFLSPHYFSELFKKTVGLSPWEYLIRVRLDEAKELLRTTERKIADIAESVGFEDHSYFTRVFKTSEGISPAEFRKLDR